MLRASLYSLLFAAVSYATPDVESKPLIKQAQELGKQGSGAIGRLTEMLKDESSDVRLEATKSLSAIGTQSSLDPLIEATRDNHPAVQIEAVEGLVNFYYPGYIHTGTSRLTSAVKGRFENENSEVIDTFVTVRPEVIAAIGRLARGGSDMNSRASAARGVGVLRGKAAVPDLLEALHSKNDKVLFESLIALQKIGDRSAGPKVAFLFRDLEERVQAAALETAGLLQARDSIPEIQRTYNSSRSEKVRHAALSALAMLPDPSSRADFRRGIQDKSALIRAASAEGFARLGAKSDVETIEVSFESEKKEAARLAQAFALIRLGKLETGEQAPLPYLLSMLSSRSYRNVAQGYLQELARESEIRLLLLRYLSTGTKDMKIGIARALAASGDGDSVEPLETLSRDSDSQVAQESLRALRGLRARL